MCGGQLKSEWRRKRTPALTRVGLIIDYAINWNITENYR